MAKMKKAKSGNSNEPPRTTHNNSSSKLHHKNDALDDIERCCQNLSNSKLIALLSFHKRYLQDELECNELDEKLIESQKKSKQFSLKGKLDALKDIYEMFPHIPVSRINVIYDEVCDGRVDGLIDVLLGLDPNEVQFTDDLPEESQQETVSSSHRFGLPPQQSQIELFKKRWDLSQYISFDIDPNITELEIDYLTAVKMRNLAFQEYGFEEEEETHSQQDASVNLDEMPEHEREFYLEMKQKKEQLKKERQFIIAKMKEAKRARNVKIYCAGEEEHLAKNTSELKRYMFTRSIEFDLEAEYIHFRIVESQFHRLLARYMYTTQMIPYQLQQVEYIVNPEIVRNFYNYKKELAKKHNFLYESMNCYLLFHGTSETNMENILKTNFLLSKVGSSTDMGFYGKGFYFSESPLMSISYSRGNPYLLVCLVMVGKAFHMTTVQTGRPLESGYDSHVSPDGCSEVIIFNPHQVIPMYKVKWQNIGGANYGHY
ncbi:hypothetical protein C9374_009074 [Naegleria lovaniensis]|uniref:PARP catalytic domain-containing protein n=1 Tax=Naegleria lovaniensis TaxID=51637 RepID=A0AA88GK26_NAELO|nr:uncharacterized protein C9374_009074 [Naegleria lovaniensis]KAG2377558.1 hypothetical protein C9374_009074 [Naegleria lovaniensis]